MLRKRSGVPYPTRSYEGSTGTDSLPPMYCSGTQEGQGTRLPGHGWCGPKITDLQQGRRTRLVVELYIFPTYNNVNFSEWLIWTQSIQCIAKSMKGAFTLAYYGKLKVYTGITELYFANNSFCVLHFCRQIWLKKKFCLWNGQKKILKNIVFVEKK